MMSKRLLKNVVMMTLLLCMLCGMVSTASAATKISSVKIKVEKDGDNYYPALSLTTSNCTITEQDDWEDLEDIKNYERVRKYITIKANEGYEFSSKPNVKLDGNRKSNTMAAATRLSSTEIRVRITYKSLETSEPEDAYWDSYNIGVAKTSAVYGAKRYRFILYVDGWEEKNVRTDKTYYDFSQTLKKEDVYYCDVYFEVCAIFDGSIESEYAQSDEFDEWSRLGKYTGSNNNGNNSIIYPSYPVYPSYPSNPPGSSSGIWPNGVGRPETGGTWELINGYWYFKQNGKYLTGWIVYKGEWYYLLPDGSACYGGWREIDNNWYYFYGKGVSGHLQCEMARNTWIAGKYYVDNNGAWIH